MKNQIIEKQVTSPSESSGSMRRQAAAEVKAMKSTGNNSLLVGVRIKEAPQPKKHVNREENDGRDDIL